MPGPFYWKGETWMNQQLLKRTSIVVVLAVIITQFPLIALTAILLFALSVKGRMQ